MERYFRTLSVMLTCWLFANSMLYGQVIRGQITDTNGRPVSNASLFIKELKLGTATNEEGYYDLKVTEGRYTCVFQCLGYETETLVIPVENEVVVRNVTLREKAYEIKEVVITDKKEDPAYGIMRRAIAMAPYYMNQVSEFNADVYLKGSLQIIKISKLIKRLAKEELEGYKEGNTYVEESFNEIEFTAPNKYKQKVLKQTGSLPDNENGYAMELITTSVYDPKALLPIISPLSSSAFAHYRFRYEGFIEDDDRVINKIKITPIHKSKQLLSGYIYIADNYWNVHSVDVSGEFVMGIKFRMQVNFGEVNENVWLPVSHRFDFNGSVLGNKGAFQYVSSVKYKHIAENTSIRKPDALLLAEQQRKAMQQYQAPPLALNEKSAPKTKTSAKIEKMLEKEDLSNREAYKLARLMQKEADAEKKDNKSLNLTETLYEDYKVTVDSAARQRDTTYWEHMRPVPLNPDEVRSYQEKEAKLLETPQQSKSPKDSSKREIVLKNPFLRTSAKVLWGTDIKLGEKGGKIEYRGLKPSKLGFNTVDGFFIGQKLTYYKDFTKKQRENRLSITPEVVWAINRKAVMWDVAASLTYAPMRRGNASFGVGHLSNDYNGLRGMYPLENTVSSLFFRRNYLKLYEDDYVEASNTIDLANGLQLYANALYSRRKMLDNHSDYSFFYRDSREYTPNIPVNAELDAPPTDHTSTVFLLNVNYTPRYFYRIDRHNRKRMVKSDFPTFFATWQKGVHGLLDSDSNFDHLSGGVRQNIETGLMQHFSYILRGGIFVNRKNIYFPDFRHFTTVEIPVTIGSISNQSFNLLEYYRYSTSDKYFEAHAYYYAPFLILKYLPFFSNRLWQEGLQLNYLYTPDIKNYAELGYTIGLVWQVGVFVGLENFKYRSFGVKVSLPIGIIL